MTIDYMNREDVNARKRKRRRRILAARRNAASMKIRRAVIIGIFCMAMMMAGCYAVYGDNAAAKGSINTAQSECETDYKSVVVRSGDTLWGIASVYSDPSKDIRVQIKEICTLNDVKPGNIYPGQIIKVPF